MSVNLPVKRTVGETLKARLTENVYLYVLPARYLRKDEHGRTIETPDEMFRRVARNLARPEADYGGDVDTTAETYDQMMTRLEWMPNSPTLMNADTNIQQLAACFVISPEDDLRSIFEVVKEAALVLQTGGGVGYSFSALRPQGDIVQSTGGVASGPVSFMHVYDAMCGALKQGGRRRGAQMAILRVDHPDIGRFVVAKRVEGVLSNFNISVAVTDEFIRAVDEDERYVLYNPRTGQPFRVVKATAQFYSTAYEHASSKLVDENLWRDYPEIEGIGPYRGQTDLEVGEEMALPARFVWKLLIDGAWRNGEPGLFMIDETNRDHSFDVEQFPEHAILATNPCAEQPLEEYEACTLGHVSLSLMVAEDAPRWGEFRAEHDGSTAQVVADFLERAVDWERLRHVTRHGTRFLENAVTMSAFPLEQIEQVEKGLRNIGLGVMGFAEMLIQMDIRYGEEASLEVARQLMGFINRESKLVSHELALERGTFTGWEQSKYAHPTQYPDWFRRHTGLDPQEWADGFRLRNHHTTSIAPTGTTSMIGNTSSGCEPLFNVAYFRNVGRDIQGQEPLVEFDDYFLRVLEANDLDVDAIRAEALELMEEGRYEGPRSLSIPEEIADLFVTARDVSAEEHVRVQAAFQEHVDSSISKTINFPIEATREDVERACRLAIELGCKGLTVYRVGSREVQVLGTRPQGD